MSASAASSPAKPKAVTTTFLLVRHGSHDRLDHVLCGRMDGVGLGDAGRGEAARVGAHLANANVRAVYSSPLQRTCETAGVIADRLGLAVTLEPDLVEIDLGEWTGLSFDALAADSRWRTWNTRRSLARPPGGESMGEAQMRAVRAVETIRAAHPDETVAAVSHSDIIKAVLAHYLGLNLDFLQRFEIEPASISTLVVGDWGAKVLRINQGAKP